MDKTLLEKITPTLHSIERLSVNLGPDTHWDSTQQQYLLDGDSKTIAAFQAFRLLQFL
ncbi:hypothetical protein BDW62DRAFT_176067 [Aspergillus aurantiobrunneus]